MARHRSTGDKPYRFTTRKGRTIQVQFDHIPGKWISTGCLEMPGAIDFAERMMQDEGRCRGKVPTFAEFAKGFFLRTDKNSIQARDKVFGHEFMPSRYVKCQALLDNYILPRFGSVLVTAITVRMIEEWIPYIKPVGAMRGPLSADTKNKILVTMRLIMDEVKRAGWRDDNPAADARPMARHGEPREALPPNVLLALFPVSPDERIAVWGDLMWATYFSIMYDTGWRPGEIAALRVCDVWQTAKGLAVSTERTVNRYEKRVVERVKTSGHGYNERVGLLDETTSALLLRLIETSALQGDQPLFSAKNRKDGLIMPETSNKHFKCVLKKLGLYHEGLVQYCLRHTYTTERRGDMPDELLAVSMGHTRLRDDYDHQNAKDLIRRLDAERDAFFENRDRLGKDDGIRPLKAR